MEAFLLAAVAALGFGIQTGISPCTLATNVAAVSYMGRLVGRPRAVLWTGLLYTVGRSLTYVVLAVFIVFGLTKTPGVSQFVQTWMPKVMGPVLVLVGMVLLGLLPLPMFDAVPGQKARDRAESWGIWGGGLLGVLFALSFCPTSASFYFAMLSVATEVGSAVLLPLLYGVGTALPAAVVAVALVFGAEAAGAAVQKLGTIEKWSRRLAGTVLILVGIYLTLIYVFGVNLSVPGGQGEPNTILTGPRQTMFNEPADIPSD
jgi:cytochrome c biogenesis protein CcdA